MFLSLPSSLGSCLYLSLSTTVFQHLYVYIKASTKQSLESSAAVPEKYNHHKKKGRTAVKTQQNMASWKKTITTPFKKACTFFNHQQEQQQHNHQQQQQPRREKKLQPDNENSVMALHGEVMACGYEDVQVMWSILDKSKATACCDLTS